MNVLPDTCIWSLALRRRKNQRSWQLKELDRLIDEELVVMMGPIRQELLSGIHDERQFEAVAERVSAFPDLPILADDYIEAARIFNICRGEGVQGSNTDFLICAVALRLHLSIFTADHDFQRYRLLTAIHLHEPPERN